MRIQCLLINAKTLGEGAGFREAVLGVAGCKD